jgi:hypothetical protein
MPDKDFKRFYTNYHTLQNLNLDGTSPGPVGLREQSQKSDAYTCM